MKTGNQVEIIDSLKRDSIPELILANFDTIFAQIHQGLSQIPKLHGRE